MLLQTGWGLLSSFRIFCWTVCRPHVRPQLFSSCLRMRFNSCNRWPMKYKRHDGGPFLMQFLAPRSRGLDNFWNPYQSVSFLSTKQRDSLIDGWLLTKEDLEDKTWVAASLFWCLSGFQWFWKFTNHNLVDCPQPDFFLQMFHDLSLFVFMAPVRFDCLRQRSSNGCANRLPMW